MSAIYPIKLMNIKYAIKMSSTVEIILSKQMNDMSKVCMQIILAKAAKYNKNIKFKLDGQFKL